MLGGTPFLQKKFNVKNWKIRKSPVPSDIIWENIGKGVVVRKLKEFLAVLFIVLLSVVLVSPLTFIDVLKPLANDIEKSVLSKTVFKNLLAEMLTPLIMLLFNFVLIPILIDIAAAFTDHQTKSGKQLFIMHMNMFFMVMNTILLPLTGLLTIREFFEKMFGGQDGNDSLKLDELPLRMQNTASFFLRYIANAAFITNSVQMLDLPHTIVKTFLYIKAKCTYKRYVDTFYFDLGYY